MPIIRMMLDNKTTDTEKSNSHSSCMLCCVEDILVVIAWVDTSIIVVRMDCHKNI